MASPGDHEQHAVCGSQKQSGVRRETVSRQHEVDPFGGPHRGAAVASERALKLIGPDAGGVDHHASSDLEWVIRLNVANSDADDALPRAHEALAARARDDRGPVVCGGAGQGD
jgi:hypothetical protein